MKDCAASVAQPVMLLCVVADITILLLVDENNTYEEGRVSETADIE